MNTSNAKSGSNTGTTSTSGQSSSGGQTRSPKPPVTEAQYLAQQADDARKAISRVVGELTHSLGGTVDPRLWAKEHPWAALGIAAAGGFAAAAMLVPSKEEQALRKLERLEDALLPERRRARLEAEAAAKHFEKDGKPKPPGIGATVVREILGVIKPAIMSAVAAGVSSKVAQPEAGGNGHAHGMAAGTAVGTAADPPGGERNV